jgi:hypothetical protein
MRLSKSYVQLEATSANDGLYDARDGQCTSA